MSWIFSVISEKPFMEWEIEKFLQTHKTPLLTIIKPSFYLAVGGLPEHMIVCYEHSDETAGWIIIGKGYLVKDTGYGFADKNDWKKFINGELSIDDIDGNYLIFRWENQYIEVWNDALGLQDCYFIKSKGYVLLSSRLDWIADLIEKKSWNYGAFGSMVLLNSMLYQESLLKNVGRLGQSGYVRATIHKFLEKNQNFNLLSDTASDMNKYAFFLNKALLLPVEQAKTITIDYQNEYSYKYLLSLLINKPKKYWNMLSNDKGNDSTNGQFEKMESAFRLPIIEKNYLHDSKKIIENWKDYIYTTINGVLPDEIVSTKTYNLLQSKQHLYYSMDFNQFYFRNHEYNFSYSFKKGIEKANLDLLIKYFSLDLPWMRKEFLAFLIKGLQVHIKGYYTQLNLSSEQNFQYFADQSILYGKGIHCIGKKSVWLDQYTLNYNPMLLASLIKLKYNLPENLANLRKNYNQLIEANSPEMTFYINQKEFKENINDKSDINNKIYSLISEEILELLRQKSIIESPYYDYKTLMKIYEKSTKGIARFQMQIIKWFTFELWRQKIE